jgi:hypothetical protein
MCFLDRAAPINPRDLALSWDWPRIFMPPSDVIFSRTIWYDSAILESSRAALIRVYKSAAEEIMRNYFLNCVHRRS